MAGATDPPFRARLRRWGCRSLTTEMVSAAAVVRRNRKTLAMVQAPDVGADLALQLFGGRPEELGEAARVAADSGYQALDFNMGCPVRKVVRSGSGAALLNDLPRAERCLRELRAAFPGRLSVKLRSGWDEKSINCLAVGRVAQDAGVDLVILHARTRSQGYSGRADWHLVAALARALRTPVVGNGDLVSAAAAVANLEEAACAGVMIGRAALAAPWIFREAEARWQGRPVPAPPQHQTIGEDLLVQLQDVAAWKGARAAVLEMRKFAAWASRNLPGAVEFRRRLQGATEVVATAEVIRDFFGGGEGRT